MGSYFKKKKTTFRMGTERKWSAPQLRGTPHAACQRPTPADPFAKLTPSPRRQTSTQVISSLPVTAFLPLRNTEVSRQEKALPPGHTGGLREGAASDLELGP